MTNARVIYKYPLYPAMTSITLPPGSEVLHVGVQDGQPVLWISEPINVSERVRRDFLTTATGQIYVDDGLIYIGTAIGIEYGLVFHFFERRYIK